MTSPFEKNYQELDENARLIADIITLIFEPVTIHDFQDFFNINIRKTPQYKLKESLSILRKLALISNDPYQVMINEEARLTLFAQIVHKPEYANIISLIRDNFSDDKGRLYFSHSPLRDFREMLFSHFLNENQKFQRITEKIFETFRVHANLLLEMPSNTAYHPMLLSFPPPYLLIIIHQSRINYLFAFKKPDIPGNLAQQALQLTNLSETQKASLTSLTLSISLYQGNIKQIAPHPHNTVWTNLTINAINGEYEKTCQLYTEGLTRYRKETRNTKGLTEANVIFYYITAQLAHGSIYNPSEFNKLLKSYEKSKEPDRKIILSLLYFTNNNQYEASRCLKNLEISVASLYELDRFAYLAATFLINKKLSSNERLLADHLLQLTTNNGYKLLAIEIAWMIARSFQSSDDQKILASLRQELGFEPMLSRIVVKEEWEKALEVLLNITSSQTQKAENKENNNRIAYLVDFDHSYIQPVLQTLSSRGWSKGRNIALKRLKEHQVEGMSEQDIRIAKTIRHETSYYGSEYYINYEKILTELAGHPYLFYNQNPDIVIELVKAQPELITEKTAKGFVIRCDIREADRSVILKKETNTRYKLIELNNQQISIIRSLNKGKLTIPASGKEQLLKAVGHLSNFMTIHSDMVATETNIKQIDADPRIRVQLLPIGDMLKAECFVKPFGTIPPYSKPGKGSKTMYGVIENEKYQAIRDLKAEASNLDKLITSLSETVDFDLSEGPITFDDPHDCLSLLETLRDQNEIALVEWPEGERLRVRRSASFNQLSLSVKGKGHWFEMEGELKVDEDTVLSLKQLLDLTAKSKGRFVELKDGEFIALTEELKKRLDELRMFASTDKSGVKINKFAAPAIENLSETAASFKSDKNWKSFLKKIEDAGDKKFKVPASLQAELRPYQEEGFSWLARLAEWDAGACLADDMGLGKTVQAIALLLHRAADGPALVVSPASVVPNWMSEIQRFAPSLNMYSLGNNHREEILENMNAFDVLITTYGILQSEEERIGKIKWNTVVLDEAHAIKNNQTKTSKAAMNIDAGFRLILTGTPLQNHLGELWNLFNFINPGLLGSLQHFNERYVIPVEKYGDMAPKQHLKKLISPFILRRTKTKVLDELPPKTEITQTIELSAEEMAFYEALRRQAIETIEQSEDQAGQQHLRALAEITRLRMACCHPSLVNDTLKLPSSKLNAFIEIMDELIENKHRALVFSQFIGHLALVRQTLEEKGISYQYLDGSTPINDRAAIVKSFQSGKGDVFLISLKAGGLGLNLTAADYVIHLDPWWNPAIEDQASDRAYRIGQSRPVTIYRLVAQNTIEEKILQLHATKRDMADSLLEGSDQSAKLSTKDLLNLLKER